MRHFSFQVNPSVKELLTPRMDRHECKRWKNQREYASFLINTFWIQIHKKKAFLDGIMTYLHIVISTLCEKFFRLVSQSLFCLWWMYGYLISIACLNIKKTFTSFLFEKLFEEKQMIIFVRFVLYIWGFRCSN